MIAAAIINEDVSQLYVLEDVYCRGRFALSRVSDDDTVEPINRFDNR